MAIVIAVIYLLIKPRMKLEPDDERLKTDCPPPVKNILPFLPNTSVK